jgi:C4-dicarboxylate transporter, DctM subunit
MSPPVLGLASFAVLLVLLALRMPIGVAMLAVGSAGFIAIDGLPRYLSFLNETPYETLANPSFAVIPLFLLMGSLATVSGLSARLFRGADALVGHLRGGLAMAAVLSCAAFGTICGSSLATAATMGQVALPEMRRLGYSGALSTGVLAAGGTLGILVPPSVPLVIYAILTEQNVAKLFLAAFIPAALAIAGFLAAIAVTVRIKPDWAPAGRAPRPLAERLPQVLATWPVVAIFAIVFIGMNGEAFFGHSLFTPTEGASIGAALTGLAAIWIGGSRWPQIRAALLQTAEQSGMIFLILLGAEVYNAFLARTHLTTQAAELVASAGTHPVLVIVGIVAVYILLGCLMDSLSMILLTVPVLFPVVMALPLGMPPADVAIWFGVLSLVVVELGLIHPPVGLNVFVIHAIAKDVPMLETFKGVVPFLVSEFGRVVLLIAFPVLSLWLTH